MRTSRNYSTPARAARPGLPGMLAVGALLLTTALTGAVAGRAQTKPAAPPGNSFPADKDAVATLAAKCDDTTRAALTRTGRPKGWTSVIVRVAAGGLTPERERQLTALGADIYRRLPIIESAALRVPTRNLRRLAALPFVQRLSADAPVWKNDEFTVQHSVADGAYNWYGFTGSGVTVAVVDSGIYPHKDLQYASSTASRIVARANFDGSALNADDCGHGTHVAGIVAGNGKASTGYGYFRTFYGIARAANLVDVRVLNRVGAGTVSTVISGLNWVVQNRYRYNIRVVNLSLGHNIGESYKTDPLCQAVESVYQSGVVVVCAAGNDGRKNSNKKSGDSNEGWGTNYGSIQSPANDPYVITVGAMKQDPNNPTNRWSDTIATYSGRGPSQVDFVMKPDIMAPGNHVISLNVPGSYLNQAYGYTNMVPTSYYSKNGSASASDYYFYLSGTSMAAPVVSGAVALMLQQNPYLSPDTVKARLMLSADKWYLQATGRTDPLSYGAGYVNVPNAIWNSAAVPTTSKALTPLLKQSGSQVLVDPSQVIWGPTSDGNNGVWGITGVQSLQVLWGTGVQETQLVTGSQVLWGEALTDPVPVLDSNVFSNQVLWGNTNLTDVDLSSVVLWGEN